MQRICTAAIDVLSAELKEWGNVRNESCVGVNWQFTTDVARIKLHRLYPNI